MSKKYTKSSVRHKPAAQHQPQQAAAWPLAAYLQKLVKIYSLESQIEKLSRSQPLHVT